MDNEGLVMRIQQGIEVRANMELLYSQNRGLIGKIVNRYKSFEDPEDLFQESYFGLFKAAQHWKPEDGSNFTGYAVFWVRQVIQRYIENCGAVLRVPVHQRARIRKYQRVISDFKRELNREPFPWELMDVLGISYQQLEMLRKDAIALKLRSFSEEIGDGEDPDSLTLQDTIEDPADAIGDKIEEIDAERLSSLLWSMVNTLKEEQAEVIRRRFWDGETLRTCGAALGFTAEKVRQIEAKALRELRSKESIDKLRPQLDETAYTLGLQCTGLSAWKHRGESSTERAARKLMEHERMIQGRRRA